MRSRAKVTSIDALRRFRIAMTDFMESSRRALTESEADVQRTLVWIQSEMSGYWKRERRKRQEKHAHAKVELLRKQIEAADGRPDAVDERRALEKAERRLKEADTKLDATRRWSRELEKELVLYKGQIQPLASSLYGDIPKALDRLDRMADHLDDYVKLQAPQTDLDALGIGEHAGGLGGGGGRATTSRHAVHRARAMEQTARDLLEIDRQGLRPAPAGQPRVLDQENLHNLHLTDRTPAPTAKVIFDRGCLSARRIVLMRQEESSTRDSGWYIVALGRGGEPDPVAVTVEAIEARRPDLRAVLAAPEGYLVMMKGTSITAVLDEQDVNLLGDAEEDGS